MAASAPSSSAVMTGAQPSPIPARGVPPRTEPASDLRPGEFVEVLSAREILSTLDSAGKLDGLPLMPEMLGFCGKRFRVSSRADSTCSRGQPRRVEAAVHLEQLRCDGTAHHGCQAGCLLVWKEAWLRRVPAIRNGVVQRDAIMANAAVGAIVDDEVRRALSAHTESPDGRPMCQATELPVASCPLAFPKPAQYFRDFVSGKIGLPQLKVLAVYLWGKTILLAFTRWARAPWNRERYRKTPSASLDLQPGEMVQVRGVFEILATLDRNACNRGMEFKAEMFQFCGRRYRVLGRLDTRIDEKTCELRRFRTSSVILESVYCHGQRSFCARGNYHYWREIWLRRC